MGGTSGPGREISGPRRVGIRAVERGRREQGRRELRVIGVEKTFAHPPCLPRESLPRKLSTKPTPTHAARCVFHRHTPPAACIPRNVCRVDGRTARRLSLAHARARDTLPRAQSPHDRPCVLYTHRVPPAPARTKLADRVDRCRHLFDAPDILPAATLREVMRCWSVSPPSEFNCPLPRHAFLLPHHQTGATPPAAAGLTSSSPTGDGRTIVKLTALRAFPSRQSHRTASRT